MPQRAGGPKAAAAALKAACQEAADNSVAVAKAAADGRKVIGGSRKFASRAEAKAAKIAAAKAKREAKAAAEKAGQ